MWDLHAVAPELQTAWAFTVVRMNSPAWLERKVAVCGHYDVEVDGTELEEPKRIFARRKVGDTPIVLRTDIQAPKIDACTGTAESSWSSTALGFEGLFRIDGCSVLSATKSGCKLEISASVTCLTSVAKLAKPFIVSVLANQLQDEMDFIADDLGHGALASSAS